MHLDLRRFFTFLQVFFLNNSLFRIFCGFSSKISLIFNRNVKESTGNSKNSLKFPVIFPIFSTIFSNFPLFRCFHSYRLLPYHFTFRRLLWPTLDSFCQLVIRFPSPVISCRTQHANLCSCDILKLLSRTTIADQSA